MKTAVIGAGSLGGYLAVALSAAGEPVVLHDIPRHGGAHLIGVRADGSILRPARSLVTSTDPDLLGDVQLCLVAVKTSATASVARMLRDSLPDDSIVVTFQNGLGSRAPLEQHLGHRVSAGVCTFNATREGNIRRQTSRGRLFVGALVDGWAVRRLHRLARAFARVGQHLEVREDIDDVLAGKLLLNLNNGVCAATGLNIDASIRDPDARWCYAQCLREGLHCLRMAGHRPAALTGVPPDLLPWVMRMPSAVVGGMTQLLVGMDPKARSSTLQDLDRGRTTEIEALNGAVVDIATRYGVNAPVNGLIVQLVHDHESRSRAGLRPHFVAPAALRTLAAQAHGSSSSGRFWVGASRSVAS